MVTRRALGWGALLAGLLALGFVLERRLPFLREPAPPAVDMMPLLLGSRALLQGLDPSDPVHLQQVYEQSEDISVVVRGFQSYYPPTASLIFAPLGRLPYGWLAASWRLAGLAALLLTSWFLATAGRSRGVVPGLAAAALVGALFLQLRLTPVVLRAGQISPLVVLLTAVALWGLARARRGCVWAFLLGAGIKLLPLLLLPSALALRRWRWLWAAGALASCWLLALWLFRDAPYGLRPPWLFGAGHFFTDAPTAPWARHGPPALLWLWRLRLPLLGGASALALVATLWARQSRELSVALGGLLLALAGAASAGGQHYHESILCLPALGLVLAWPALQGPRLLQWTGAVLTLAAVVVFRVLEAGGPPNPPHWLPISYLVWTLCLLRWIWARRRLALGLDPDQKPVQPPEALSQEKSTGLPPR